MDIGPATAAELPEVERLRMAAFSAGARSVWRGVPADRQLAVRLRLWESDRAALSGLLVAREGGRVVGTVALDTATARARLHPRDLPVVAGLGPVPAARLLVTYVAAGGAPAVGDVLLHDLVVAPPSRGRSVGRALVIAAERWSRERRLRSLHAEVERTNLPSLGLFTALGYAIEQPRRHGVRRALPAPTFLRARKDLDACS